jgi:hypothetical protein
MVFFQKTIIKSAHDIRRIVKFDQMEINIKKCNLKFDEMEYKESKKMNRVNNVGFSGGEISFQSIDRVDRWTWVCGS